MALKVALFTCFIITFIIFSCSSGNTTSGSLKWWCTQTPHYETCNRFIADGNPSSTPLSANQFLDITVQAAIDEARLVLQRAQRIESTYPNVPGKSLWDSCVDYFDGIVFTLNVALDHTLQPTPLDVHTWLSAGLTYASMCEKGFELINLTNAMQPLISTNLTELLLNSLAISVVISGSTTPGLANWNLRNDYKLSDLAVEKPDVVVAQDGSGQFKTIQEAVDSAIHLRRAKRFVIYVKAGIYQEYVMIPKNVQYIKMFGDGINKTIITGDRHLGAGVIRTSMAGDLKATATFQVWSLGFIARDMTFRNTAGPQGQQAVAFLSGSDQSALYHCSFEGYQDTLFTYHSRQFYKECQIFGTVDFIFGNAHAVFQDCSIYLRKPLHGGGLVVTAQGRKYLNESSGYTLQGCNITAAHDLKRVIGQYKKAFLGRPWFEYAITVYMQSFIDGLVDPRGWLDSWGYNKTVYYGEYNNYGPGSSTDQRVKWLGYHVIKDQKTADYFTVANSIAGNYWLPQTGVPFIPGLENQ